MRVLCFSIGIAALASAAHAGVIYDNGSPPGDNSVSMWFAETGVPGFSIEVADDFILSDGLSTIRDVHWWGNYVNGAVDENAEDIFTLTIYNDAAVAQIPGSVNTVANALTVTRTPVTIGNFDMYFYSAEIDAIALTPGTRYWLGISNAGGLGWGWVSTETPGNLTQSGSPGQWRIDSANAAFYLTDDVPTPGGLALVGVLGIVGARRRR